jgi:hypothetical protein
VRHTFPARSSTVYCEGMCLSVAGFQSLMSTPFVIPGRSQRSASYLEIPGIKQAMRKTDKTEYCQRRVNHTERAGFSVAMKHPEQGLEGGYICMS